MNATLRGFQIVTLTALCLVLWDAHKFIGEARITLRLADPVMGNVNSTTQELAEMARIGSAAMQAETKRIDASTKELQKTEASARLLIVRTDESLNGGPHVDGLLPQATESVKSIGIVSARAVTDLDRISTELEPSLESLARGTESFAQTAADPAIEKTLANLESVSESSAGIARDAKESADLAEAKLKQALKPASMVKTIFLNAIGIGYQVRSLLGF